MMTLTSPMMTLKQYRYQRFRKKEKERLKRGSTSIEIAHSRVYRIVKVEIHADITRG